MTDIPPRLAARPRDKRGYPIPCTILIDKDGKPDFRVNDMERWVRMVAHRRCAMCGEPMGRHVAFIGGPLAHVNRLFTDAGMHLDCAQYAMATCPYLALPRMQYLKAHAGHEGYAMHTSEQVSVERPERFFIGITRRYQLAKVNGDVMLRADAWDSVEWFTP